MYVHKNNNLKIQYFKNHFFYLNKFINIFLQGQFGKQNNYKC